MGEPASAISRPQSAPGWATSTVDLLDGLTVGAVVVDAGGSVVYENRALRDLWSGHLGPSPSTIFPQDAYGSDGQVLGESEWPIWRSLERGAVIDGMPVALESADGEPISLRVSSRPLRDGRGLLDGAVMLVEDVTGANDRLDLREAFVGVLSHELRTPITAIYSGVDLLRGDGLEPGVREGILDDLAVEAESLNRMIEDLLAIARLERGVSNPAVEPVLVQRVIAMALDDERRRWPNQTFTNALPSDLPPVRADEGLVRQILRNLVSNAAKYGRPDGIVAVTATADADEVHVHVLDDGPGIPERHRDRVFDLLYRGTASQSIPGAGIGLYVARALAEAMDGRLRLGDRATGAEFVVDLPRYPVTEGP